VFLLPPLIISSPFPENKERGESSRAKERKIYIKLYNWQKLIDVYFSGPHSDLKKGD
jgi:hypothetical protein